MNFDIWVFSWNLISEYFREIWYLSIFMKFDVWVFSWSFIFEYFHEVWYLSIFMKFDIWAFSWNLIFEYFYEIWCLSIFMKFDIWVFSWNLIFEYFFPNICRENFKSLKYEEHNGCFTWKPIKILIILCPYFFLLRKSYRLWDNVKKFGTAGQATDEYVTRRMRVACWIPKATDAHSEYAILIACSLQHGSHKRTSILRYTYSACLVTTIRALLVSRLRTEKTACGLCTVTNVLNP